MSNKIDGFGQRPAEVSGGSRSSAAERTGTNKDRAVEGAPAADKVTLTDSARLLQRLSEAVASASETDAVRVAALKAAVARGEYQADSGKVADRMIALERDLAGR